MNDNNIVENNTITRKCFNKFLKKYSLKEQKENTISKTFSKLNTLNLIGKINKGIYNVNPLYFFKGTEEEREKLIRKELEKPIEELIKKYRHKKLTNNNAP